MQFICTGVTSTQS